MATAVHCSRCGREAAALEAAPMGGELGEEIRRRICSDCWQEWREMEVKVINELRLNFMDPEAEATLHGHLRAFLFPDGEPAP